MSSSSHPGDDAFGNALLSYSRDGVFPDEDASAAQVASSVLPAALDGLRSAKNELEVLPSLPLRHFAPALVELPTK